MSHRLVDGQSMEAIRRAAESGDWNRTAPALDRALACVEPGSLLVLAEGVLRDQLPTFEHHHPGAEWPRRALDGLETGLGPEFTGPGGSSFAKAVEDWLEAVSHQMEPHRCRELIASCLRGAIMAAMCAVWGAKYPEAWERWYTLVSQGLPTGGEDPMGGWSDTSEVQRAFVDGWNDLADRLARFESGDDGEADAEPAS